MRYFAGLDVSLEETAIRVADETGRIAKEARAASDPQALSDVLRKLDLPLERIGLEACSMTAWLRDGLRTEGLPAIRIETRQANAVMKTMPNKTDRNDARAQATDHAHGLVPASSRQEPAVSSLALAPRRAPHGPERDAEGREHGAAILREAGIRLGTPSRATFADRVRELAGEDPGVTPLGPSRFSQSLQRCWINSRV